ncbi:MAG TPA: PLP-dependent aminotransferase family protein [Thermoanaerobaculia bacterium]|nr:PLP-dependent aminotransferase family protein [Thermoanaerobaculia bacterium]
MTVRPAAEIDFVNSLGAWSQGSGPFYRRLANGMRSAILRGDLPPGARVPAERNLARLLAVSRTTVVSAYEILRQEAWLESRQGSGTRVRPAPRRSQARGAEPPSFRRNPVYRSLIEGSGGTIEFLGAHLPGTGAIPEEILSLRDGVARLARGHGYLPAGLPELRRAIAKRLDARGLPTKEDEVLVTSGAQQAIGLVATLFLQRGDAVAVESPTYLGAMDLFTNAGAHLVPVPVGEAGVLTGALKDVVSRASPRLAYLVPTFHNPTGSVVPEAARREIARIADQSDTPIVEDDTLADLTLGAEPPPPIGAFSRGGTVITVGSLSKVLWGGLRIGWIRASEPVLARLTRLKILTDLGCSILSQLAAVELLAQIETIRRARRREVRTKYGRMARLLKSLLPSWTWTPPAGGLSLWVRLPHGDATGFAQVALRHGVAVVAGPLASPDSSGADRLRLPFVHDANTMTEGMQRLGRAWRAYSPEARGERTSLIV